MKIRFLFLLGLVFSFSSIAATEIWVSVKGNDNNTGSKDSPKATLHSALRLAREWRRTNNKCIKDGVTICLDSGTYFLYESLFIRPEDSGTEETPLVIKGVGDSDCIISGGVELKNWKKKGKLYVADVPDFNGRPLEFRQLWINGTKAVRARDVDDFEKMYRIKSVDADNSCLLYTSPSPRDCS